MTSWHSLLACAQADVTMERITSLAASMGTEPLTVDFKEKSTPRLAECVASMANAHGGLIFVGITDTDRRIVGVKTETMAYVADMLATRLDPADWLPEMFEVPLGEDQPGKHILVIRIRRELVPRPVLVQRTIGSGEGKTSLFWIPVRIPGGTRQATRAEMAALFAEQPATAATQPGNWDFDAPQMPSGKDGLPDPQVDMMLKTGLRVPPGPACPGRPLSERAISELAAAVDKSPLAETLFNLTGLASTGIYGTHRRGRPNTAGTATLIWQIAIGDFPPSEMTVRVEAPGQYGHPHIQTLNVSIEITSRLTAWQSSSISPLPPPPGALRRLEVSEWAAVLNAMVATLTDPRVVAAIADLADVDPILVPPPRVLHIVSNREIAGFLPPQLRPIPDASGSHGAHLQADPTLSLTDPEDRTQQVTRWLCQIAADAGLTGMEGLLTQMLLPAGRASLVGMADPFSPEAFYESARDFALSALEAHHVGNRRRVPIDAGTALEHLAKACLAQRSPVLLAELKGESGINSVIGLLRLEGAAVPPTKIRTVGLSEALTRVGRFTRSKAVKADLDTLIDMRNGIVHAAESIDVEERILTAFTQQADALLADLGRDREDFWRGQLPVVDALLKDASDKLAHRVQVRLASAQARFEDRIATNGDAVINMIRVVTKSAPETTTQRLRECPVCDSSGTATGEHRVDWDVVDWDEDGTVTNVAPTVWFSAQAFRCQVCGLHLDTPTEIDACFDHAWEIEDADWHDYEPGYETPDDVDWRDYEPADDDTLAAYEEWREDTDEQP